MKRIAYTNFSCKEKVIIESTDYVDAWGKTVWTDANGMVYELQFARLSKVWAATPLRPLTEGIKEGWYKLKTK